MIVTTEGDVVHLQGDLLKNQWLTIKAAAKLLLEEHPEGIVIDCGDLRTISEAGSKTFLDAVQDIQSGGTRIVVTSLPDPILQVIRSVPGVRSQLPISYSVEEARASLRMAGASPAANVEKSISESSLVLPLFEGSDARMAVWLATGPAREEGAHVYLVYLLEVGRNLAIGTPMVEKETAAQRILNEACADARKRGLDASVHLERVRDLREGALQSARSYKALAVVLCAESGLQDQERFRGVADFLLERAPCSVLLGRSSQSAGRPNCPHEQNGSS